MHRTCFIAFDVDGTLVDTASFEVEALQFAIRNYNKRMGLALRVPTRDQILGASGLPSSQYYRTLLDSWTRNAEEEVHALSIEAQRNILVRGHGRLFAGVNDVLQFIHSKGVRICAISNGSHEYLTLLREHILCVTPIDKIISCHQLGLSKSQALSNYVKKSHLRCIAMIGDREDDIAAAEKVKAISIACLYGFGKEEEPSRANEVVRQPEDLLWVIKRIVKKWHNCD